MAKTRLDRGHAWLDKAREGRVLAIDCPVRLDDCECAEDVFGDLTWDEDLVVDRVCTAQPTGNRTWTAGDDEHFMQDNDYILD